MRKMMTVLLLAAIPAISVAAQGRVEEKSRIMAENDPTGIVMTVTAAGVVFFALIILYIIYKYIGKMLSGELALKTNTKRQMKNEMTPETALAIAMALDREKGGETEAAIGLALHEYLGGAVHDEESFVLTIRPTFSAWASRYATLRQLPDRK